MVYSGIKKRTHTYINQHEPFLGSRVKIIKYQDRLDSTESDATLTIVAGTLIYFLLMYVIGRYYSFRVKSVQTSVERNSS